MACDTAFTCAPSGSGADADAAADCADADTKNSCVSIASDVGRAFGSSAVMLATSANAELGTGMLTVEQ